jgi:large subunit ribosomal protein L9
MKVFLLKDVPNVGMSGVIKKVEDGFARNFLFPRNLAVEVTKSNEASLLAKVKKVEQQKVAIVEHTSDMANKIKALKISIKKKMHDNGKLYGAISEGEIVAELAREGIIVDKSKVELNKSIKTKGTFEVVIKLTSRLKPALQLQVLPE